MMSLTPDHGSGVGEFVGEYSGVCAVRGVTVGSGVSVGSGVIVGEPVGVDVGYSSG